jgi:hypothetical protein
MKTPHAALTAVAALALLAGCGGSKSATKTSSAKPVNPKAAEVSPSGDIPDNQAFVAYAPPGSGYSVKVPEGWSRAQSGKAVVFTDKLNSIRMEPGSGAPTLASVRKGDVPALKSSVKGFKLKSVQNVMRRSGPAIRIVYLAAGKPNALTGKARPEAVERYIFPHSGKALVLTLAGPKGADNVDPWRIVTDSVRWK